jgi:hypothetical protein
MGDSILTSARYWQQTGVRCIRTFAQAAGGVLGVSATGGINADWQQALSVGAAAAAIALLMSLEKLEELPPDTAEEAAVDAILHANGVASGDPLPPLPAPPTAATTTTQAHYVPGWQTTPPASTAPVTTIGYPTLGDPA